ncbi:hypothetical protein TL16_g05721 [Triparma laevis f. inornata]|uniref:Uncharacterized protein n=1 Tax=Triparma laevis f. inornata TaxID=1714386 RepID=A0A9W7APS4_9STRA|nr:hypothetical protein TL16_g05721 [Triparma laevis f. inornata]
MKPTRPTLPSSFPRPPKITVSSNKINAIAGPTKSMVERINERLAIIAASRGAHQKMELDDEEAGARPFTPTDHALTERPRLANMGLFPYEIDRAMNAMADADPNYQIKLKRTSEFRKTFPKPYVEMCEAEPETMQFDQTVASDKNKQTEMAKEFISRNRRRMWMFDVGYVKKSHPEVLDLMLDVDNFPGLMDELVAKERKLDRGSGSEKVTACLKMPKKLIKQEFLNDDWLSSMNRTSRKERMNRMFGESIKGRNTENCRVSCFKGF